MHIFSPSQRFNAANLIHLAPPQDLKQLSYNINEKKCIDRATDFVVKVAFPPAQPGEISKHILLELLSKKLL